MIGVASQEARGISWTGHRGQITPFERREVGGPDLEPGGRMLQLLVPCQPRRAQQLAHPAETVVNRLVDIERESG